MPSFSGTCPSMVRPALSSAPKMISPAISFSPMYLKPTGVSWSGTPKRAAIASSACVVATLRATPPRRPLRHSRS